MGVWGAGGVRAPPSGGLGGSAPHWGDDGVRIPLSRIYGASRLHMAGSEYKSLDYFIAGRAPELLSRIRATAPQCRLIRETQDKIIEAMREGVCANVKRGRKPPTAEKKGGDARNEGWSPALISGVPDNLCAEA